VTVIPTWAPDNSVDNRRSARATPWARLSPAATRRSTADGSSATRENSAATKMAVPAVSTTPSRTSNHSISTCTSPVAVARSEVRVRSLSRS